MSLLYKTKEEQTITLRAITWAKDTEIEIEFYSDCGKFGTDEPLTGYTLTAKRLLQILRERGDITDSEKE